MYLSKVLVGKYTKGEEGLLVPPQIDAMNPYMNYDSVVDSTENPQIYVVFYDYQHYPEYLITFKAESTSEELSISTISCESFRFEDFFR